MTGEPVGQIAEPSRALPNTPGGTARITVSFANEAEGWRYAITRTSKAGTVFLSAFSGFGSRSEAQMEAVREASSRGL